MEVLTLTINDLLNAEIALTILDNTRGLEAVTNYRIGKNCKAALKEIKDFNDTRIKMAKEFAIKDENNEPIIIKDENGNGIYSMTKQDENLLNEKLDELKKEEVKIEIRKVSIHDILKRSELSPRQMFSIEFMLNDLDDLDKDDVTN